MEDYNSLVNSMLTKRAGSSNEFDAGKYANYEYAADNHSYGNGGNDFAFTDPTTWGTGLSNAGKFIVSAAASGLNSFYNTGVTVGNWLGADLKENDVAVQLAAIDSDLGKYYEENRESADLAGFVATSLIPGLGGVKLLHAGQKALKTASATGILGTNMARATGLLVPEVKMYRALAAADIANSGATAALTSANTIKAIGAGYGQAALEAAAFETAVAATMFKSPTLSEADGWDIAKNIAVGTLTGGVIGGAITHAATFGAIKKEVLALNPAEKLFTDTSNLVSLSPAQRIIARQDRLVTMPSAPTTAEIMNGEFAPAKGLIGNLPARDIEAASDNLATKFNRMRTETATSLSNKNRLDFQEIAGGDSVIGNQLADFHATMNSEQSLAALTNLDSAGRVSTVLKEEQALATQAKKIAKAEKDGVVLTAEEMAEQHKIGYIKLTGEGAGNVSFEAPKVLGLADTVKTKGFMGADIPLKDAVLAEVNKFKFNVKKPFSAIESSNHTELEARYIWADRLPKLDNGIRIGEHDIPLIEKAVADKLDSIVVATPAGDYTINSFDDIAKHLLVSKQEVAHELMNGAKAGTGITTEEIAKITNVKVSRLEGEVGTNEFADMYARQDAAKQYEKYLRDSGLPNVESKVEDFAFQPTHAKAAYNTKSMEVDGNVVKGMAYIKAQQKAYQETVNTAIATHLPPELYEQLWHATDDVLLKSNRYGAGPGLVTFANGGYHTPESWAESIGSATSRIQKHFKNATSETIQAPLYKLASNPEAAIEFETINKKLMSSAELYGLNAEGTAIEPLKMLDYKAKLAAGEKNLVAPTLADGTELSIPIKTDEAYQMWKTRTDLTGNRTRAFQDIRNAQGLEDMKDARALRPVRQDPNEFPFFAIVVDPTITSGNAKSMIHAASEKELDAMIAKVPSQYKVITKKESELFHKSVGDFDFENTLHENYIDSNLKRTGVNNPFFVRTDPKVITESILKDHLRSDDIFSRELVNAKFEKEFSFLRQQGEQFTNAATSRYTGSYKSIENSVDNPYTNYMKTALNISQVNEHPLLVGINTKLDQMVSKGWNTIESIWKSTKSPEDLAQVEKALTEFGVKHAYRDAATELLANHTAPRGVLTKFVGQANSILSTLVTRLDPLNAINNAVGANVLYGTELKSVMRSLQGDTEAMGALSGLLKMPAPLVENITPQGVRAVAEGAIPKTEVTSAGKLMLNAVKNFTDKEAKTLSGQPLKEFYAANGWSSRLTDQFHSIMEDLSLVGTETPAQLNSKIQKVFTAAKELTDKGEKITGNKLAEEFNRFVAADTMRQITDIGVRAGKITEQEALGYINTFVNRTQGNILASQRPLMFQGPVGQAIGLFQTFQFNTMQQLFRHVSEGSKKDAAMLMGLQGTMYGMNGLPAFNFLNTHIVGSLSGNPNHQDLHSATYGIAGKNIGDMLLYGLPSNLLRANLYTRGDINPRSLTVVPSNPADIPFVAATARLYSNTKDFVSKVQNGAGVWESLLQGIEHNGLSRPLAGLSQVAQAATHGGTVFSTTTKGNIGGTNDLFSWATAVRLAGGKPFDEAVVSDTTFRITAYQAADRAKMDSLAKAIKSTVVGGGSPDADQVGQFAEKYAALGGQQQNFNKYMLLQMKTANTTKANMIMENLKNPYSQKMQQVMGGVEQFDGRSMGLE